MQFDLIKIDRADLMGVKCDHGLLKDTETVNQAAVFDLSATCQSRDHLGHR